MLGDMLSSALPHVRSVNPHVASIIASAAAAGHLAPHLPRQDGPAAAAYGGGNTTGQSLMGISSFAFQVLLPC